MATTGQNRPINRGDRLPQPIKDYVAARTVDGWRPSDICRELNRIHRDPESWMYPLQMPSEKTIKGFADGVRAQQQQVPAEPWTVAQTTPGDLGLALDMVAEVVEVTEGQVLSPTQNDIDRGVAIQRARPDLPAWVAYQIGQFLRFRVEWDLPTTDLDMFLAFAPWRGPAELERYTLAVASGLVPEAPSLLTAKDFKRLRVANQDAYRAIRAKAEQESPDSM